VADVKDRIGLVKDLPGIHIEAVTVEPINLIPFNNSIANLDASVVGVHNILHAITTDPIVPPAIRPPDLTALRNAIDAVRKDIQQSAAIKLPQMLVPVLPAIDHRVFDSSYVTVADRIAALNNLFTSVDNTAIQAPKIATPDFSALLSSVQKAKANIDNTFLEPIPTTEFTSAAKNIESSIKEINSLSFDLTLPVPSDAALNDYFARCPQKAGSPVVKTH
jgi:hypothetical protein